MPQTNTVSVYNRGTDLVRKVRGFLEEVMTELTAKGRIDIKKKGLVGREQTRVYLQHKYRHR